MALAKWHGTITDLKGNVLPHAQIYVVDETTGATARLFSDRNGLVGLSNPFSADAEGFAGFHVIGGAYRITASLGGYEQVWRYVGIGTAQETDIDSLAEYLSSGIVFFQTYADMNAYTPDAAPATAVVLADSDPLRNGYYTYEGGAWVYARALTDTIARLYITGGGVNNPTATVGAGVNPSSPLIFYIDVDTPNTGSVTLAVGGVGSGVVLNVAGNPLSAGEWSGRVMLTREADGSYKLMNDPASAQAAAQSATDAANSASVATTKAGEASNSATASAGSASTAVTKAGEASTSAASALSSKDDAQAANTAAQAAKTAAETARTQAASSASAAAGSATSAGNSASAASGSATTASTQAGIATGAATDAETARDYAYEWSSASVDDPVNDGVHSGFSAYHWSVKAQDAAGGGVQSVNGDTGPNVTLTAADVGAATSAQGSKADTALQTLTQGANITITGTGTSRTIAATVPVTSVNSKTGPVVLSATDVGALPSGGKAADSSLLNGQNAAQLPVSTATQTALSGKVNSNGGTMSADPTVPLGVATKQYVDDNAGGDFDPKTSRLLPLSQGVAVLNTDSSMWFLSGIISGGSAIRASLQVDQGTGSWIDASIKNTNDSFIPFGVSAFVPVGWSVRLNNSGSLTATFNFGVIVL